MQWNNFIQNPKVEYLKEQGRVITYFSNNLFSLLFKIKIKISKRSIEETNVEEPNSESEYDDSKNQLRKKIKLENQKIVEKIKEIAENIDISEHEVHKFLLILLYLFIFLLKQLILKNHMKKRTDL